MGEVSFKTRLRDSSENPVSTGLVQGSVSRGKESRSIGALHPNRGQVSLQSLSSSLFVSRSLPVVFLDLLG